MAYINTNHVKQIRESLKKEFPEIKFSVRRENYSSVHVGILKSPYDFSYINRFNSSGHTQLNRYHLPEGKHKKMFEKILNIIMFGSDNKWFDRSESQFDYFETSFYIHLGIGDYGKGYEMIPMKETRKRV